MTNELNEKIIQVQKKEDYFPHAEQIKWLVERKDFEIDAILRPQTDTEPLNITDITGTEHDQSLNQLPEIKVDAENDLKMSTLLQGEPQINPGNVDVIKESMREFSHVEPPQEEQNIPFTQRFNPTKMVDEMQRMGFIK